LDAPWGAGWLREDDDAGGPESIAAFIGEVRAGNGGGPFEGPRADTVAIAPISGSILRTTKLSTMRSAGRLTAAEERTPMIPHVILRT
jgi:hypothetical protein